MGSGRCLQHEGVRVILLYWSRSSDLISTKRQKSELAKGYAALPTPLLLLYTTHRLDLYLHYTFYVPGFNVPGFGLYQVFFYQVFCLFSNVPVYKVPGNSKKYQV